MSQAGGPWGRELRSEPSPPPLLPPRFKASRLPSLPLPPPYLELAAWLIWAQALGFRRTLGSRESLELGLPRLGFLPGL